jgi:type IV secretion system protein VirD4
MGKTSGPAICNALLHPGPLICLDPKGTIAAVTAVRRRAMGQKVHILDLREGRSSDSLNPLDLARLAAPDPGVAGRMMADCLVLRGIDERDPYWSNEAERMLGNLFAEVLLNDRLGPPTVATVHGLLNGDNVVYDFARRMDCGDFRLPATRGNIATFLSLPDSTTRPCVLTTTQSHLRLWDIDLVRSVTDSTSFDLAGLIAGKPVTLYIVVPPTRLAALAPLLNLWISGLLNALSLRERSPRHRTLVMIDEAASLGRMDALVTSAALLRAWGVQIMGFWQSIGQLDVYRQHARTLVDNAGVIQVLGVRNARMAREFHDLVGGLSPDALLELGPRQQVLALDGGRPFVCDQVRYYDDPLFRGMYARDPLVGR